MTNIPILWNDEALLVISKPAGLLALPDGYDPSLPHVKSLLTSEYGPLWIVHRLDRDTSGVMVLARSAAAHKALNTQFQERQVKKVYKVLVIGNPPWDLKTINLPLSVNVGRRHHTVIDNQHGKLAVTQFMVCERFKEYCLLEAIPQTGRRHQIRAHLAHEGYPIACDGLYGNQKQLPSTRIEPHGGLVPQAEVTILQRIALHASSIELAHPMLGQRCVFESPLPLDMEAALGFLRRLPADGVG